MLILASSSPYRKLLLERLGHAFEIRSPRIDETPLENEQPLALVRRLARQKADKVAALEPGALVIGSDQLAVFGDEIIGKPGTLENNIRQLTRFSGQHVVFNTALCVMRRSDGFIFETNVPTEVHFRDLSAEEIERYVTREQAVDCAGGFKSESGGIALFRQIRSDDPTALIGLPLIALSFALRKAALPIP